MLPRSGQPRLRQERERRHGLRRVRARPGLALGGRRALGPRRSVHGARLRALRTAHGRREPPLPLPRRCRGGPPGVPSGRDDAGRQPAARAAARRPRVLGGGRHVAQRLRRCGRHRPGAERLDHRRRSGRGHRAVPRLAIQRHLRRSDVRGRPWAGGVQRLLPAALPARRGCRRPAPAPVAAARTPAGARCGLRDEGGLGTGRSRRAGSAVASFRARPGELRLDASLRGSTGSWRRAGPSGSTPASST